MVLNLEADLAAAEGDAREDRAAVDHLQGELAALLVRLTRFPLSKEHTQALAGVKAGLGETLYKLVQSLEGAGIPPSAELGLVISAFPRPAPDAFHFNVTTSAAPSRPAAVQAPVSAMVVSAAAAPSAPKPSVTVAPTLVKADVEVPIVATPQPVAPVAIALAPAPTPAVAAPVPKPAFAWGKKPVSAPSKEAAPATAAPSTAPKLSFLEIQVFMLSILHAIICNHSLLLYMTEPAVGAREAQSFCRYYSNRCGTCCCSRPCYCSYCCC